MPFFSILLALIFEQKRAGAADAPIARLLRAHAARAQKIFDVGKAKYDVVAWLSVVLPWTLTVALLYLAFYRIHFLLAFAWNVLVVYFTIGFRQFNPYFTDIHRALKNDDVMRAREILKTWTGMDTHDMPVSEIIRQTVTQAIIAAHRHLFGVFFWLILPVGPAGAVLYRVSATLARAWGLPSTPPGTACNALIPTSFSRFAQQAFDLIDWIPARLTAFGFAVVGNFEDAVYAWRAISQPWLTKSDSLLLAVGGGALGVSLAVPPPESSSVDAISVEQSAAILLDEAYGPAVLQRAESLVWRAVVLWMIVLLIVTLAVWM